MKKIYHLILCLSAGVMLLSCGKEEIEPYNGIDYVNLSGSNITLSFDLYPIQDTLVTFKAKVMGYLADHDREVAVVPDDTATTAVKDVDFKLEKCIIPANGNETELKCKLFKPENLQDGDSLIIKLNVGTSGDFLPGVYNTVRIKILAGLPSVWSDDWWTNYTHDMVFGQYLKEKYRFLIRLFKTPEKVKSVGMDMGGKSNWQIYLYTELKKETDVNGPLIDKETGKEVTFPISL